MRRGPGFLLLFSIKSKKGLFCFAEIVPNGRAVGLFNRYFRPTGRSSRTSEVDRLQLLLDSRFVQPIFFAEGRKAVDLDFRRLEFQAKAINRHFCPNGHKKRQRICVAFCNFNQTLNRNSTTSPSFITYSFPSERTRPCSLAAL